MNVSSAKKNTGHQKLNITLRYIPYLHRLRTLNKNIESNEEALWFTHKLLAFDCGLACITVGYYITGTLTG